MHPFLRRAYFAVQKRFFKTEQDRLFDRWFTDRGDQTLRLDYDLTPSSIVFDLGGYKGDWAEAIYKRYGSRVLVFEPVERFAKGIRDRFPSNRAIEVFTFGLGAAPLQTVIHMEADASSQFARGASQTEPIEIREFAAFVRENGIETIDLLKINIEGAEYEVLEHLLDHGLMSRIRDIQVQFHDFVPGAKTKRDSLRQRLQATHKTTYDYPFVWENWRRIEN
jgi:FkbM family methyltransferase